MKRKHLLFLLPFCAFTATANAQDKPSMQSKDIKTKGALEIGISDEALIEDLMPLVPGLGSNSREMLTEQSVKSYMMPPRDAGDQGVLLSYALATLLEFYVNYDENYKVNLSPDYLTLNLMQEEQFDLKSGFKFLIDEGTVSAAIMPYGASTIPRAVFATEKYTISNYLHVVRPGMKARQRVFETKKALMRGNPVLVQINVPESFSTMNDTRFWIAGNAKGTQLQPFIVVGYDQDLEAFEITGFWGNEWAHNGYLWMDYDDFGKYVENGFVMMPTKK